MEQYHLLEYESPDSVFPRKRHLERFFQNNNEGQSKGRTMRQHSNHGTFVLKVKHVLKYHIQ